MSIFLYSLYLSLFEVKNAWFEIDNLKPSKKMKKISGVYKITKNQLLDNIIILFSVIVNIFDWHNYLYGCQKKLILSITDWTFLGFLMAFLFSENKTDFRFFPRKVGYNKAYIKTS